MEKTLKIENMMCGYCDRFGYDLVERENKKQSCQNEI